MTAQERIAMMLGQKDIQIASMSEALEQASAEIVELRKRLAPVTSNEGDTNAAGEHPGDAGNGPVPAGV